MQKTRVFALLGATFIMSALTFENCGKVQFQNMPESSSKISSAGTGATLDDNQIQQIVANIPPEELVVIHPLTDLQDPNNDYLYDIYECGDGAVLICHFPQTGDGGTQCIGKAAVPSHYDHVRTLEDGSTVSDHVGPCR